MAARSRYVEFLIEALSPLGQITSRAMFGGYCLYCDGIVFALVADDTLYLKVDRENEPDFEAAGLKAFCPYEDRPETTMSYRLAPPEVLEDTDALERWAGGAVAAGLRAQARKKPRKKPTPTRRKR